MALTTREFAELEGDLIEAYIDEGMTTADAIERAHGDLENLLAM
jgi:hypothetical protein